MTSRTMRFAGPFVIAIGIGAACSSPGSGTVTPNTTVENVASSDATTRPASSETIASSTARDAQPTTIQPDNSDQAAVAGDDTAFLAMLYSLMGVGTEQESVISMTVGNAAEADVARCMTAAGFQYQESQSPEEQVRSDLRQSMPADEYATSYGFGVAAGELGLLPQAEPMDPNMELVSSLSQGQRDAYYQTHRACSSPAPGDRFRNSNAWNVALEQFRGAVDADERMVAAFAAWRDCMASAGFDYETPNLMRLSFYSRLGGSPDRAELEQLHVDEVAAATPNVPCEATLTVTRREVVNARVEEFRGLFDAAVATGAAPDAAG